MSLLIDTNILIWMHEDDPRLVQPVKDQLLNGEVQCFISAISAWEYEQKRRKRPDLLPMPFGEIAGQVPHTPLAFEYELYPFASGLPPIHSDPFDRMLIAQAIHHDLEFVASDKMIHQYPVRIFW